MKVPSLSPAFHLWLLGGAIVGVFVTRAPLMTQELWNLDEGSTYTMAQQVLAGDVLYRDATDHRSPLVAYLKSIILVLVGDWNARGVQLVLCMALGLVGYGLALIARYLAGTAAAWCTLAAFLGLQILWLSVLDSLSVNTEWFVLMFSTAGFVGFLHSRKRPGFRWGLLVGLAFGGSLMCKQPGLLDGVVVLTLGGLLIWRDEQTQRMAWARFMSGSVLGMALPTVAFGIYFASQGAWADYRYFAFTFNTEIYIPEVPLLDRLWGVRVPFAKAWENTPLLGGIGVLGALGLLAAAGRDLARGRKQPLPLAVWLPLGWTFAGLLTTTLSGRDFDHYSLQTLPGLSLIVGVTLHTLWQNRWWGRTIVVLLALGVLGQAIPRYRDMRYLVRHLPPEPAPIAQVAREFSTPDERIFVWGYYPETYFYAQRLPASRFVYTNFVTGMVPWTNLDPFTDTAYARTPNATAHLQADLTATPAAVIIDTGTLRNYARFPLGEQPWLWSHVQAYYAQVATSSRSWAGMRAYRRLEPPPPGTTHTPAQPHPLMQVSGYVEYNPGAPPQLATRSGPGFTGLTLFNGERAIAHLPHVPTRVVEVRWFVPAGHQDSSHLWVRGERADGSTVDSAEFDFAAYRQKIADRSSQILPLEVSFLEQIPPRKISARQTEIPLVEGSDDAWELQAPARLHWEVPMGLNSVSFVHGHLPSGHAASDGYDLTVRFFPTGEGHPVVLSQQRFNLHQHPEHQLPQSETITLPDHEGGTLELFFTNGPRAHAGGDEIFLHRLQRELQQRVSVGDRFYGMLHPPTELTGQLTPSMRRLRFDFGIEDKAFDTAAGNTTDGVRFHLLWREETGTAEHQLWSRYLNPLEVPTDRGVQHADVLLPAGRTGQLILRTTYGPQGNGAFDWAYVGDFQLATD